MKQNFQLNEEKSALFIKYFYAAMRNPEFGYLPLNGHGRFEDGYYISKQSVNFKYKGQNLFVRWELVFENNNILVSISNLNSTPELDLILSEFLNSLLQKVINNERKKFFIRTIYRTISGCNMSGEYWLKGFRIAPLFPEDGSFLQNAERILVIDQNVSAIDLNDAREIANENASKYSAYLSFILNKGIELPRHEELYFLNKIDNKLVMERKSNQIIPPYGLNAMPKKKKLCDLGEFKHSVATGIGLSEEELFLPVETRKIISRIDESTEEVKAAFLRCCKLYQLGLNIGRYYPTVKLSYMCGAIDSIVKSNKKEYGSFSEFMTKYSGEDKDTHNYIHNDIRSAHWHSGNFELGEFDFNSSNHGNPGMFLKFEREMYSQEKMRVAILNWLNQKINFLN